MPPAERISSLILNWSCNECDQTSKGRYFKPSLSRPPTSHSAHLTEAAHTQPHDVWVPWGIEGEYKCSVLGEYSFNKEGIRVKTANVRRCSSSKGGRSEPLTLSVSPNSNRGASQWCNDPCIVRSVMVHIRICMNNMCAAVVNQTRRHWQVPLCS